MIDRANDVCKRYVCGYCGAQEHEHCKRPSGAPMYGSVHADRYWQARKVGALPLHDDEPAT